jgi:hypothetical protein
MRYGANSTFLDLTQPYGKISRRPAAGPTLSFTQPDATPHSLHLNTLDALHHYETYNVIVSQPSKSSLPQVAYSDAPEAMAPLAQQAQAYHYYDPNLTAPEHPMGRTIFGLRRSTFWLCLVLIAVVIIAAVGGGVGGSIAVKNAKSVTLQPRLHWNHAGK